MLSPDCITDFKRFNPFLTEELTYGAKISKAVVVLSLTFTDISNCSNSHNLQLFSIALTLRRKFTSLALGDVEELKVVCKYVSVIPDDLL